MNQSASVSDLKNRQMTKQSGFPGMLEKFKGEIARALPRHISGDRMARIALTEYRKNPALFCRPAGCLATISTGVPGANA